MSKRQPVSTSRALFQSVIALALMMASSITHASPAIDQLLATGKLAKAQQTLSAHLADSPDDDLARFKLGTVQLFQAVEQLAQDGSRFGAFSNTLSLPFVRIGGIGKKTEYVEPVAYQDIRDMIARFQEQVAAAEKTLAAVQAESLDWRLDFGKVFFDLNGDGVRKTNETLDYVMRSIANFGPINARKEKIAVDFDAADVVWLRGYCHVLQALADMTLAYDHQRLFDLTAHAFFANPQTEYIARQNTEAKDSERKARSFWGDWESITDLIAAIHLMDFKLIEPERMQSAHQHLLTVIQLSRHNWELIAQETDDRDEWIPGVGQTSVIPGLQVGPEQVKAWHQFLNETEALLKGEKLAPFWRSGFTGGVNLKRVFTEPRDFDLVLWVQGTAALPYLEDGEQTDLDFWEQLQRTFRGRFLGFALWTN